jgi:RNA methyltransferase, TrmH family
MIHHSALPHVKTAMSSDDRFNSRPPRDTFKPRRDDGGKPRRDDGGSPRFGKGKSERSDSPARQRESKVWRADGESEFKPRRERRDEGSERGASAARAGGGGDSPWQQARANRSRSDSGFAPRRDDGDDAPRSFKPRSYGRPGDGERPRFSRDGDAPRPPRSFDRDDARPRPPRSFDGDRPAFNRGDRPDRPARDDRAERSERPRRFDAERSFADRGERKFSDRGERKFSDRGERGGERPSRFGKDRPIRPYGRPDDAPRERGESEAPTPRAPVNVLDAKEVRIYGKHAVLALAKQRVDAFRKVYYHRSVQNSFGDLFSWCAANRIGYREVEMDDLQRLSGSEHHEGVVADVIRGNKADLADHLPALSAAQHACIVVLDGVGNPHNLGAILRNAAHFGVDAVMLMPGAGIDLSGAAYRVAEGGAEAQPLIQLQSREELAALEAAGFKMVIAHTRQAKSLWQSKLPHKMLLVFGAEGAGVSDNLLSSDAQKIMIPGSGKVESLNVAQSVAVVLAEAARQKS